jgi:hypothetical protein
MVRGEEAVQKGIRVWGAGRLMLEPGHVPVMRIVDLSLYAEAG